MEKEHLLLGLMHLYDEENDETVVSWAYRDHPDLQHFVLEVYDDINKQWRPYDNRMGIIPKEK